MECAHPPEAIQDTSCAGFQHHGHPPVNPANRRTVRSQEPIIDSLNRRDCCWHRHPASIASNSAGSGRSGVAPVTSDSAADPPTPGPIPNQRPPTAPAPDATPWHQMQRHQKPHRGSQCNRPQSPAGQHACR